LKEKQIKAGKIKARLVIRDAKTGVVDYDSARAKEKP